MTHTYLVDGCLVIDNSSMALVKACPTLARYKLIERRERAGAVAKGRAPGKAIHSGLETRYRLCGGARPTDQQQAQVQAAVAAAMAGSNEAGEAAEGDEYLSAARLADVMRCYRDGLRVEMGKDGKNGVYDFPGYGDEPFEVLWVEVAFAVRLGEVAVSLGHGTIPQAIEQHVPIIYIGRSDLGVRMRERGELLVCDHKSMRRWSNDTIVHWNMAAGPKGYAACIPQWVREGIGGLPAGVQVAMAPWEAQRQALAAAGVGDARINGFLLNALVMRDVVDLSRVKEPPTAFRRHTVFYQEHVLNEWRADALRWARAWLEWCAAGAWPMNDGACSMQYGRCCQFYDCCTLPPEQRALMLSTDVYKDATWSPLNRDETAA